MTCRFRHKFKPRYQLGRVEFNNDVDSKTAIELAKIQNEICLKNAYIHDICIKCGKIVKDKNK